MKDNTPDWKVQTSEWNVEDTGAWKTEDTDKFFYEIEEKKKMRYYYELLFYRFANSNGSCFSFLWRS